MMKKIAKISLAWVMAVAMVVSLAPLSGANYVCATTGGGTCGTCNWNFDGNTLTISGGEMDDWGEYPPWYGYREDIEEVVIEGSVKLKTGADLFYGCQNLTSLDVSKINTSKVTDMSNMFGFCRNLSSLNLSSFDTSNVENMAYMFEGCESLTSLNLSNFVTSKVTDMFEMFYDCYNLSSLNLNSFDTSNVEDMAYMFQGCESLTSLNLSSFVTSKVRDMSYMFYYCHNLSNLNISNFDTSNVWRMAGMFDDCESLTGLNLSNFDTSSVEDMEDMFYGCESLTSLDLSNFNASNVEHMGYMFWDCDSLENLKVGKGFNKNISDDSYAEFPKTMYDSDTGEEYSSGDRIPSIDYRTYTTDETTIPDFESGEVEFSYIGAGSKKKETTVVYYSNDFFSQDNDVYNHRLGAASLGLAMAGMKKTYAAGFLRKCGFRYNMKQSGRYDLPLTDDQDKVAYTFATKEVNGGTILAVVLRGGEYGNEWGSNGRVGHSRTKYGYHYGFNAAAEDIIDNLENYCSTNSLNLSDNKTKVWLTGYSRSAAVANCVGAKLEKSNAVKKSNLYCYTFATPGTVTEGKKYGSAQGIYNIVNPLDLVPCVPLHAPTKGLPGGWNYTRHGQTLEFPSKLSNMPWTYDSMLKEMEQNFESLTEEQYSRFNGAVLQELLNVLCAATISESNYVSNIQDQLIVPALEKYMGKGITNDQAIISVISVLPGARTMLKAKGFLDKLTGNSVQDNDPQLNAAGFEDSSLGMQHWPETYLAWMKTDNAPKKRSALKSIIVQCPVDVEVYDPNGNLAARITDDTIDESIECHLEAYVDEAGAKVISIPTDGEYSVKLTATDNGTMTYSVVEKDEDRYTQRKVTYEDISIQENQIFNGDVNEEIGTDASNYNLETGEDTITYDNDYSGEDIGAIGINVEVSGDGSVMGDGLYTMGDSVVLEAFANDGSKFDGWYQGDTLVSKENTLTFAAKSSAEYKAKFSGVSSDPCAKGHTWTHIVNNAGFLTNGNEYDQCTVCGIQQNQAVIPGYASYYVKGMKVAKGKGSLTVKWKKQSKKNLKKFNGYQIRYATKSDMSNAKYKTAGKKATSKKIGKLKKKTKYFVQVRTYTKKNGITFYSKWSGKKSVKTK